MKLAVIGGGNMGAAFAGAFLKSGIVSADNLTFVELDEDRREFLADEYKAKTQEAIDKSLSDSDWIVLAVKPQNHQQPLEDLKGIAGPDTLLISVMTGIRVERITELTGCSKIIRTMPNTPILVGRGVTSYISSDAVSDEEAEKFANALSDVSLCIKAKNENQIDAATSVSASGAGFAFYFAEHLVAGAMELGYKKEDALNAVRETIAGAMELWAKSGKPVSELREQVTSKGGTTYAGLNTLTDSGVDEALKECLKSAYHRAVELSKS